jgi:hypothetical protein
MPRGFKKNGEKYGFKKGYKQTENHKNNIRNALKGKKKTVEHSKHLGESHRGQIAWNKGLPKEKQPVFGKHWKLSEKNKINMSKARIGRFGGEKCHLWKGGITPEMEKIRKSIEYKLWRKAVFERDNFTCQKYGTKVGGTLRAHHINNFAEKEELRFAIDNGITLSEKAHREFHRKYGIKNNTQEQLEEFLRI